MDIAIFNTKPYDARFFRLANEAKKHRLHFLEPRLSRETLPLAQGYSAICIFVNDFVDAEMIQRLAEGGTRVIALRCSGFNNLDVKAALEAGFKIVRVPAYSPHAVAEHTIGLLLTLNRQIYRAHNRVREGNFALDGLLGYDVYGKTAGIIGTGRIGSIIAHILAGFGCKLIAYDRFPNPGCEAIGVEYKTLDEVFAESDILTLHCPLMPETHHIIDDRAVSCMKPGVTLLNTSRGALIDTRAVIEGLKRGTIGAVGLDVYEEEADLFFEDLSNRVIQDDVFARLLTFPNVVITGHQAYFTREALHNIAHTTLQNISDIEERGACDNEVTARHIKG